MNGIQEVVGSIPIGSTNLPHPLKIRVIQERRVSFTRSGRCGTVTVMKDARPELLITLALSLCLAGAFLITALHILAIPYALWQGDEYNYFHTLQEQGVAFAWHRLFFWSPRPLSELLITLYGFAVAHWHQPLIGIFLGSVWFGCALLAFGPLLATRGNTQPRLCLAALTMMLLLLGHPIADLHYWPMGTVAHLPVMAAATCLTMSVITGCLTPRLEALCLSIALASSEEGLFLAGACLGLRMLLNSPRNHGDIISKRWLLLPALLGLLVLWRLIAGRMGLPHPHHTPTEGRLLASLGAAIGPFFHNLLMLQPNEISAGGAIGGSVRDGILLKALIALASAALCRAAGWRPPLRPVLGLIIAFAITAYLMIAAAYYEFGFLCCQRHETARLDLSALTALLLGAAIPHRFTSGSTAHGPASPVFPVGRRSAMLIACGCMILFTVETARWRYADMRLFLATRAVEAQARTATWASGHTSGPHMTLTQGANTPLFSYWPWQPGLYRWGGQGWDVQSMMAFFGKQSLTVRPPLSAPLPTRTH